MADKYPKVTDMQYLIAIEQAIEAMQIQMQVPYGIICNRKIYHEILKQFETKIDDGKTVSITYCGLKVGTRDDAPLDKILIVGKEQWFKIMREPEASYEI